LIAAEGKTMWSRRREFSDERRGGEENGAETTAHFALRMRWNKEGRWIVVEQKSSGSVREGIRWKWRERWR
jgi:hypothetical protein